MVVACKLTFNLSAGAIQHAGTYIPPRLIWQSIQTRMRVLLETCLITPSAMLALAFVSHSVRPLITWLISCSLQLVFSSVGRWDRMKWIKQLLQTNDWAVPAPGHAQPNSAVQRA